MNVQHFVVNINSTQPDELIRFYQDVVGLTPAFNVAPGAFMVGSSSFIALIIEEHDAIEPATREPARVLLNFVVDDLESEQARLEAQGVTFVRPAAEEPGIGTFATFADPDGNYCQLAALL